MTSERRSAIDFAPLLAGLVQPLQLISDPDRRRELEAYISAARPQIERAAFDVLSQAVTAFNDASRDQKARLEYADGRLFLTVAAAPETAEPETSFDDSDLDKVTLRLPKELKRLIDNAAGMHGISANNWYVRELSRIISHNFRDAMREEARSERRGYYRGRRSSLRGFVGGE
jgi:predicted HicB family RNase H-like nuclease